jgi:hypothetical protein
VKVEGGLFGKEREQWEREERTREGNGGVYIIKDN